MNNKKYTLKYIFLFIFLVERCISFAQSPIAYYPFDGNVKDASGNNNHGKIIGNLQSTSDRYGNFCSAMNFNGIDAYIEVPNSKSLRSPRMEFSITTWININTNSCVSSTKWLTLLCKGDSPTESPTNPQYRLQVMQSPIQSTISINTDFTEFDKDYKTHEILNTKWQFYALTYDGNTVKTYLDGVKIFEFPYSKILETNDANLYIGKDIPGALEFFCGSMDDLKIYNVGLSESFINQEFTDKSTAKTPKKESECPEKMSKNTSLTACGNTITFNSPREIINCDEKDAKQVFGLKSGSFFPVGNHKIGFEIINEHNYIKTCYTSIEVKDLTPPVIKCSKDVEYSISGMDTIVNYSKAIATDNCSIKSVTLKSGLESGKSFPIGVTINVFETLDIYSNLATCSNKVTITKKEKKSPPKITQPEKIIDTVVIVKKTEPVKIEPTIKEPIVEPKQNKLVDPIRSYFNISFSSCKLTMVMYDDNEEDGDTVSVYFDKEEIVSKERIYLPTNKKIIRVLDIVPGKNNQVAVKAWNTGTKGENTLKIDFYEGDISKNENDLATKKPKITKVAHSVPGRACGIILKCN